MPQIDITISSGRTSDQIRSLIHEVHQAVVRTVNAKPENVRIVIREVPRSHWATGDRTLSEMDADAGT